MEVSSVVDSDAPRSVPDLVFVLGGSTEQTVQVIHVLLGLPVLGFVDDYQ